MKILADRVGFEPTSCQVQNLMPLANLANDLKNGGEVRSRTEYLLLAKQSLYLMSYIPLNDWRKISDSNA